MNLKEFAHLDDLFVYLHDLGLQQSRCQVLRTHLQRGKCSSCVSRILLTDTIWRALCFAKAGKIEKRAVFIEVCFKGKICC